MRDVQYSPMLRQIACCAHSTPLQSRFPPLHYAREAHPTNCSQIRDVQEGYETFLVGLNFRKMERRTHILRRSHTVGKGRDGTCTIPTSASASSFANMWASKAPVIVSFTLLPNFCSTSFLRSNKVAMISALSASTTRVALPWYHAPCQCDSG